ncbi:hypothetical protein B0T16DRAFT_179577 [Cercophora newfieldiana]|uniref:Uncharacterized protein n=1 Tax=Cercophora newfieldiana TaxID=92897 RepID=A0AA39XZQ5_9PEZI|nr:hypothetical protein B0T16DRAFT_179577 [Cercophora newfieldiana]
MSFRFATTLLSASPKRADRSDCPRRPFGRSHKSMMEVERAPCSQPSQRGLDVVDRGQDRGSEGLGVEAPRIVARLARFAPSGGNRCSIRAESYFPGRPPFCPSSTLQQRRCRRN